MSQKNLGLTTNQFETYSGPEVSFENINTNFNLKKKNIRIKDAQKDYGNLAVQLVGNGKNNFKFSESS